MYAVAPTPKENEKLRNAREKAALIRKLRSYSQRSQIGESRRCAADRRGAKLEKGEHFDNVPTSGRLAITSNLATTLAEHKLSATTRYEPIPAVEAIREAEDDAAALLEGGLIQVWRYAKMQQKIKQGGRLSMFTRPAMWYTFWDQEAKNGIGYIDTRVIPGFRQIIDDNHLLYRDMEYVGFWEKATRAKLTQLFPDKADEIENASPAADTSPLRPNKNPLRDTAPGTPGSVNRLVADSPNGPWTGKQTLKVAGKSRPGEVNPLHQEVLVEYLWINDPTPVEETRPKKNAAGHQMYHVVRDPKTNEIVFEIDGYEAVDSPMGPIYQPTVRPKLIEAVETRVVKKYKGRRHIAWIPQDEIILWDVAWDGPIPLTCQRDSIPLEGYWVQGTALRAASLNVARNIFLSIIFERIRLSLSGTWLADRKSGLKKNKLVPEVGVVYQVNDVNGVKEVPVAPLDPAYFQLLEIIETEMMKLLGVTQVMQGQAAGRADSPDTYDKLIEQAGEPIADAAQMLEQSISEWAEIVIWFMQTYFTHEHMVEVEDVDGGSTWRAASALAIRGDMAVHIETGSMISLSESARYNRAREYASMGIYALPMLVKMGHVPHGKRALKQKMAIQANPRLAEALLGGAGAPPSTTNTTMRAQGKRSHHAPGSGR